MTQPQLGCFDFTRQLPPRPETTELRAIEQTFAYLHATREIEAACLVAEAADADVVDRPWFDLHTRERDVADEVKYLDARNLLEVHPVNRSWVRICDEDEPLTGPVQ